MNHNNGLSDSSDNVELASTGTKTSELPALPFSRTNLLPWKRAHSILIEKKSSALREQDEGSAAELDSSPLTPHAGNQFLTECSWHMNEERSAYAGEKLPMLPVKDLEDKIVQNDDEESLIDGEFGNLRLSRGPGDMSKRYGVVEFDEGDVQRHLGDARDGAVSRLSDHDGEKGSVGARDSGGQDVEGRHDNMI